ncbi:MAG: DegT/DnrJ/EryC1/StrS family aminotransferase [Bacillota bacterium]|nr:DegT/DnrJ/EryC1/StrS family aminotransferase [Bacillota bacterium]
MGIPLVDLNAQYQSIKEEVNAAVSGVINSGKFIMGKHVREFEENFAQYSGSKFAISVANGTDALVIALKALGIGPGDEIVTTPFTFFATCEAIVQCGAKPVFADIDAYTYNIDPDAIKKCVTGATKAIIPVHIFGNPANMDSILEVAQEYRLIVVEDACQAVGANYKGKKVGTIGDAGCFSFFPSKNLGCCGDGGMIITDSEKVAVMARALRSHGGGEDGAKAYRLLYGCETGEIPDKYNNYLVGYNSRLDEMQAAILNVKLRYIDRWNQLRRQKAYYYNARLKDYPFITPKEEEPAEAVYHIYTLRTNQRDKIIRSLKEKGIEARVYYHIPLHLQKALGFLGYRKGDFINTETVIEEMFSIPMYPELTVKEQDYIIDAMIDSLE